jgi:hypothetical protein
MNDQVHLERGSVFGGMVAYWSEEEMLPPAPTAPAGCQQGPNEAFFGAVDIPAGLFFLTGAAGFSVGLYGVVRAGPVWAWLAVGAADAAFVAAAALFVVCAVGEVTGAWTRRRYYRSAEYRQAWHRRNGCCPGQDPTRETA